LWDAKASENAYCFNLMCRAGLDIIVDEDHPADDRYRFTGEYADEVISLATTTRDRIAHKALCGVADQLTTLGRQLPPALQRYIVDAARFPINRRRGRHFVSKLHRDDAIFHAVEIAVAHGLLAMRNEAHADDHESGCSVVSVALRLCGLSKMKESAVATVWQKRRDVRAKAGFKRNNS
jgi:hypothetical protein